MHTKATYDHSTRHVEFWESVSSQFPWITAPTGILHEKETEFTWFPDGTLNLFSVCLDKHVNNGKANDPALLVESAYSDHSQSYTYKELSQISARMGGVLQKLGADQQTKVLFLLPNSLELTSGVLGTFKIGSEALVLPPNLEQIDLVKYLNHFKPDIIVMASHIYGFDLIKPYVQWVKDAVEQSNHRPEHYIIKERKGAKRQLRDWHDYDLDQLLKHAHHAETQSVSSEQIGIAIYGEGNQSSGMVQFETSHMGLCCSTYYPRVIPKDTKAVWHPEHFGMSYGIAYGILGPLMSGQTIIISEGQDMSDIIPYDFWRIIEKHKVSAVVGNERVFEVLNQHDEQGETASSFVLTDLRYIVVLSGNMKVDQIQWLEDVLGVSVVEQWGMETSFFPLASTQFPKLTSTDEEEEIWQLTPFEGYGLMHPLNARDAITEFELAQPVAPGIAINTMNKIDHQSPTFPTGCFGRLTEQGLILEGRAHDFLELKDSRIHVDVIADICSNHPGVNEAVFIQTTDANWLLYIQKKEIEINYERLLEHLKLMISNETRCEVDFILGRVNDFPRTLRGGINRKAILNSITSRKNDSVSLIENQMITDIEEAKQLYEKFLKES